MLHQLFKDYPGFSRIAKRYHRLILLTTVILSISSFLALAVPYALKNLVEHYSANTQFTKWAIIGCAALVFSVGLKAIGSLGATMVAERLKASLQLYLYQKFLKKHIAFHREHGPGDLMSALYHDISQLSSLYTALIPTGISSGLIFGGSLFALGRLDPTLASFILLSALLIFGLLRIMLRKFRKLGNALHQRISWIYKTINETFRQIVVIKTHLLEDWAGERLIIEQAEIVKLNVRLRLYHGLLSIVIQLFLVIALLIGWMLLAHSITPQNLGTQLSTLLYGVLLVKQVSTGASLFAQYRQTQGALDRLHTLLEKRQASDRGNKVALETLTKITIQNLDFFYNQKQVFDKTSLAITAGEKIALIGPNGAGKTTLLNLLVGLEQPLPETMFWNEIDISKIATDQLCKKVAYLPQDSLLSQASIADNLRMGKSGADEAALWYAAEQAGVANIIRQQSKGMDTLLGSEGSRLSGGEKRRLALARLLIQKYADLYLLDEPTEGLDHDGEQQILTTAFKALAGKTIIIVTHRLAALEYVDRVLEMKSGRVTERFSN